MSVLWVPGCDVCYFIEVRYCDDEEYDSERRGQFLQSVAHYVNVVTIIVVAQTETLA